MAGRSRSPPPRSRSPAPRASPKPASPIKAIVTRAKRSSALLRGSEWVLAIGVVPFLPVVAKDVLHFVFTAIFARITLDSYLPRRSNVIFNFLLTLALAYASTAILFAVQGRGADSLLEKIRPAAPVAAAASVVVSFLPKDFFKFVVVRTDSTALVFAAVMAVTEATYKAGSVPETLEASNQLKLPLWAVVAFCSARLVASSAVNSAVAAIGGARINLAGLLKDVVKFAFISLSWQWAAGDGKAHVGRLHASACQLAKGYKVVGEALSCSKQGRPRAGSELALPLGALSLYFIVFYSEKMAHSWAHFRPARRASAVGGRRSSNPGRSPSPAPRAAAAAEASPAKARKSLSPAKASPPRKGASPPPAARSPAPEPAAVALASPKPKGTARKAAAARQRSPSPAPRSPAAAAEPERGRTPARNRTPGRVRGAAAAGKKGAAAAKSPSPAPKGRGAAAAAPVASTSRARGAGAQKKSPVRTRRMAAAKASGTPAAPPAAAGGKEQARAASPVGPRRRRAAN